jgi:hypothetical protein
MILEWRERPRKDWVYPFQLLADGHVVGGMRVDTGDVWTAVCFFEDRNIVRELSSREEAEAWLIALVRMS